MVVGYKGPERRGQEAIGKDMLERNGTGKNKKVYMKGQ